MHVAVTFWCVFMLLRGSAAAVVDPWLEPKLEMSLKLKHADLHLHHDPAAYVSKVFNNPYNSKFIERMDFKLHLMATDGFSSRIVETVTKSCPVVSFPLTINLCEDVTSPDMMRLFETPSNIEAIVFIQASLGNSYFLRVSKRLTAVPSSDVDSRVLFNFNEIAFRDDHMNLVQAELFEAEFLDIVPSMYLKSLFCSCYLFEFASVISYQVITSLNVDRARESVTAVVSIEGTYQGGFVDSLGYDLGVTYSVTKVTKTSFLNLLNANEFDPKYTTGLFLQLGSDLPLKYVPHHLFMAPEDVIVIEGTTERRLSFEEISYGNVFENAPLTKLSESSPTTPQKQATPNDKRPVHDVEDLNLLSAVRSPQFSPNFKRGNDDSAPNSPFRTPFSPESPCPPSQVVSEILPSPKEPATQASPSKLQETPSKPILPPSKRKDASSPAQNPESQYSSDSAENSPGPTPDRFSWSSQSKAPTPITVPNSPDSSFASPEDRSVKPFDLFDTPIAQLDQSPLATPVTSSSKSINSYASPSASTLSSHPPPLSLYSSPMSFMSSPKTPSRVRMVTFDKKSSHKGSRDSPLSTPIPVAVPNAKVETPISPQTPLSPARIYTPRKVLSVVNLPATEPLDKQLDFTVNYAAIDTKDELIAQGPETGATAEERPSTEAAKPETTNCNDDGLISHEELVKHLKLMTLAVLVSFVLPIGVMQLIEFNNRYRRKRNYK